MNKDTFAIFDREMFADWLWRGLRTFYDSSPPDRVRAFDPAGFLIIQQESVSEGLAYVYHHYVPDSKRLMFRQAIGDVLREKGNDQNAPIPAFQDLIYLLVQIRATESLTALLPTIGNGLLGQRYPDILYETVAALRLLAPSVQAHETASSLINSNNFDDGYLFEAIKVLIECQPSLAAATVLSLKPRLNQLRQAVLEKGRTEYIVFNEAANDWSTYILRLAPITWLAEFWKGADHTVDNIWLFELFFTNSFVPVLLLHDPSADRYLIAIGAKKVFLKVSWKDHWTRRKILLISSFKETTKWATDPIDEINRTPITKLSSGQEQAPASWSLGYMIKYKVSQLFSMRSGGDIS